jgi:hypothetical protein
MNNIWARTKHKIVKVKSHVAVLTFLFYLLLSGQVQASSCFQSHTLEPNFIALATDSKSSLANWYQQVFALETVKTFAFPDRSVTGKLMRKGDFVVEIFARKKIFDRNDYQDLSSAEHWRGVMKFGFYTDAELPKLKQCLLNKGINAGRIYHDENLKVDLLQVLDPEKNILEIIQRKAS